MMKNLHSFTDKEKIAANINECQANNQINKSLVYPSARHEPFPFANFATSFIEASCGADRD
jgi:hypothetical protein